MNAQVGCIVAANAALKSHGARFQACRIGQDACDDCIARMHAQTLRRSILGQHKEIGLETRIKRLDHTEGACRLIRAHHAYGRALDNALDHGTAIAARSGLNAHGHDVAVHNLALAATHNLIVAIIADNIGAMLMELHAARQAGTPLAAHRRALVASATLMFVIAPHGASLLSVAGPAGATASCQNTVQA